MTIVIQRSITLVIFAELNIILWPIVVNKALEDRTSISLIVHVAPHGRLVFQLKYRVNHAKVWTTPKYVNIWRYDLAIEVLLSDRIHATFNIPVVQPETFGNVIVHCWVDIIVRERILNGGYAIVINYRLKWEREVLMPTW